MVSLCAPRARRCTPTTVNAVAPAHSPRMIGMGRAILIIGSGALAVGLVIYALIECAQSERYRVRAVPKGAWLLIILCLLYTSDAADDSWFV